MKGDDPQIDTAQTPKRFNWHLALQGKIQKIFADSIPNKLAPKYLPLESSTNDFPPHQRILSIKICGQSCQGRQISMLFQHRYYKRQMQKMKNFLSTLRPFKLKLSSECD